MTHSPSAGPSRTIPVFFCNAMQARVESLSPSAHKPLAAVESWASLAIPLTIIEPTPVTREELARAHDRGHVDAILECRATDGFYARGADVAASLPYIDGKGNARAARLPGRGCSGMLPQPTQNQEREDGRAVANPGEYIGKPFLALRLTGCEALSALLRTE